MTRAAEKLVIITDGQSRSPFLDELQKVKPLENIEWRDYPAVRNKVSRLVIKVGNQDRRGGGGTFAIKDQLKASGYQWQTTGWPGWAKTCLVDGFQISSLQTEVWVDAADAVEIRIFDETEQNLGIFRVTGGEWLSIHNELASVLADTSAGTANADEDSHLEAGEPM